MKDCYIHGAWRAALVGGERDDDPALASRFFDEPTVLVNCRPGSNLAPSPSDWFGASRLSPADTGRDVP